MAAKIVIPEQLKQELPQNKWGKVLGVTPIVMTVIATMLAGLASSEMTKGQYDRSLGAELNPKPATNGAIFRLRNCAAPWRKTRSICWRPPATWPRSKPAALPGDDGATIAALTQTQLPAARARQVRR